MSDYSQLENKTEELSSTRANSTTASSSNDNYVDFNQFILQHNFVNPTYNGGFNLFQPQQQQQQPTIDNYYGFYPGQVPYASNNHFYSYPFENSTAAVIPQQQDDIYLTSNLMPTAAEFIPRFNNMTISSESLPQNITTTNNDNVKQSGTELKQSNELNTTNKSNTGTINKSTSSSRRQRNFDENRPSGKYQNNGYSHSNNNSKNMQKAIEMNRQGKRRENWKYNREMGNHRNEKYDTSDSDDSQKFLKKKTNKCRIIIHYLKHKHKILLLMKNCHNVKN